MKKFLPNLVNSLWLIVYGKKSINYKPQAKRTIKQFGFTLVELLVVIAIIAILATIGFTVFSGTGAKARDAKRKADINQIASAYEVNYDQATGAYVALAPGQFTAGDTPHPPESPTGSYTCVTGPSTGCTTNSTSTYTVCAALDAAPAGTTCTATTATCYCRSAAQAAQAGGGSGTGSCQYIPSGGLTCKAHSSVLPAGSTVYVNCPTSTEQQGLLGNNCSGSTTNCIGLNFDTYDFATGGTLTVRSLNNTVCTGYNDITVKLHTP